MLDTAAQRANMVAAQLRTNDVTDWRIRAAMLAIPRERFVPEAAAAVAYMEGCIEIAPGRVLLDARSFAKLVQLAAIGASDKVLDVGCGTGYSTLVLSSLAAQVVALEQDEALAAMAERHLNTFGARNTKIVRGSLSEGYPPEAPYDVIVVNGAIEVRPDALLEQLANDGRLVCVRRQGAGHAHLYVRHGRAIGERSAFDADVPVLPGFEKPSSFVF